ncbi:hypothetical protein AN958_12511 [Leucoagaricus sp. SymC.cos]|nr:hypothetical protein AN958_12511 [Leucoagaricus sp. SymC.cos]
MLAFTRNDTRLVVGVDNGSIYVYDTAALFSSGSDPMQPLSACDPQVGALRQIAPNPGVEPDLVDLIAVVRSDGSVQLMNTMLESLGGWAAKDINGGAVAVLVSWSPKGKHVAIGLQSGDVVTFAPNNKSAPNKRIPPAAEGRLVGLNWLSPGHTFRLTYAPQIENEGESVQHIVSLDTRSNTLSVFNTIHPFTMSDRQQESHALVLPHWDEDSISENTKSLVVIGDRASADLEILGGHSGKWYQHSQENPVALPLDRQTEETVLMTLDVDLTDTNPPTPILYAYLNDGSLQAWYLEHSKLYPGMMSAVPGSTPSVSTQSGEVQDSAMDEKEAANVLTSLSSLNQPISASPFSPFGSEAKQQPSAFGSTSMHTPIFGQPSQPSFGQTSTFGSLSPGLSAFGQPPTSQSPPSVFGSTSTGNAFANIAAQRNTTNVFGASSFGVGSTSQPAQLAPPDDEMTREASMSDGTTPGFGGLSLGDSNSETSDKPRQSVFGNFGPTPSTSQTPATSAFGGNIKPVQGLGTFSNFGTSSSSNTQPTVSAFSSPPQSSPHPAFGQTGFGKPAFGQPVFGQTGFGKPTTSSVPGSGGFAAFASTPSAFGSAASATPSMSGFASFPSGGGSAFGSPPKSEQQAPPPFASKSDQAKSPSTSNDTKPSPFGSSTSVSAFGSTGNSFASSTSNFDLRTSTGESTTPQGSPVKAPPGVVSPPSSPEPMGPGSPLDRKKTVAAPTAPVSGFLQQSSSGLGALGSIQESSPFFKKPEAKAPTVTAFGNLGTAGAPKPPSTTTGPASGFGAPSQLGMTTLPFVTATTPAFGATSQLGAAKSAFGSTVTTTPPGKPPASGAFSAFSGSLSGFSAFAGQTTSFSDLLKSGGDAKEPEKTTPAKEEKKEVEKEELTTPATASITPKTPLPSTALKQEEDMTPQGAPPGEQEPSLSNISVSSIGSFVDVGVEKAFDDVEREEGEEEGEDTRSFLSSDFSSGPPTDDEASGEEDEAEIKDKGKGKDSVVPSKQRSPSPTPQPEVPSIQVTPSPPTEVAKSPPTKEESTTPPGSPSREAKALSKSPSPTPLSTPSTPSTPPSPSPSPFVAGFGRPSTRPARSSPLAAAPVSGVDEEGESEAKEEKAPKPSLIPKPLSGKQLKKDDDATAAKRPGTPPLLSSFGSQPVKVTPIVPIAPKPEPSKAQVAFALPSSPPLPQQPPSVFSQLAEPAAPVKQESPEPTPTSVFGDIHGKPSTPSEISKTVPATPVVPFSPPPFSLAPKLASAPPTNQAPPVQPPVFAAGGPSVSVKPTGLPGGPASPGMLGAKSPPQGPTFGQMPQSAPALPTKPPITDPLPRQPSLEEGLQKECALVVGLVEKELKELGALGVRAAQSCAQLTESLGGSRVKSDLGVLEKWKVGDSVTFGQTLLQFEHDLVEMNNIREVFKQTLQELNSSMLKANARREEIARFNKAKTDKDFAKMLSTRALGPEHLESQQHLRRSIRTMRDRVHKLESHLQQSKKKLSQVASGRPSIRAPTLDVINRTYRNIDLAIRQQTDEVAKLSERVTKLKLGSMDAASPSRDARLPDQRRHSITVTPSVAVTTAAALNAERSAQKLKKALLKARKEPILNQKAALAPPPPADLGSPEKPGPFSTVSGPLFSTPGEGTQTSFSGLNFNLPEDNFHPGTPLPSTRRGAGSATKRHSSVPLKKTPGGTAQSPPSTAPASDFWGPLPVFNNPPLNKLAAEVKPMGPSVPLSSAGPSTPTPASRTGSASSLPDGGFDAFMKQS